MRAFAVIALVPASLLLGSCGRLAYDAIDPAAEGDCADTFCAGFDGVAPLAGWDSVIGSPQTDATTGVSMPGSLHVTRTDATPEGEAFLEKTFPGPWTELSCGFMFRFDHQSSMEIIFVALSFAELTRPGYGVSIHVGETFAGFFEGHDTMQGRIVTSATLATVPPRDQWVHIELAMAPLGDGSIANIFIDGLGVGTKLLDQASTVTGATLMLGSTYAPGTSPFDIRYDDVTCALR